jgi:hypothetical protein
MKNKLAIFIVSLVLLSSCQENNPTGNTDVTIHLEHIFGANALALNSATPYVTSGGDSVTFTTFKYYVSNIVFQKNGGGSFVEADSYHLVDLSDPESTELMITNMDEAEYTSVSFLLGVDSTRNVSGAQTGALDPANDMFWSWSSGYIFFKAEGSSPQAPSGFMYHIGGFSGPNNSLQLITLNFGGDNLIVNKTNQKETHLTVDAQEIFDGPNPINVASTNNVMMPGAMAKMISQNYAGMFVFEHNHN